MESLTCVKGSAARFVIDRGIDRLRPSGNRTMTNFGPRADLSPRIGSTWPKSPWRREIIRTSDTSPSTMGVFCVDRGSRHDPRGHRPPCPSRYDPRNERRQLSTQGSDRQGARRRTAINPRDNQSIVLIVAPQQINYARQNNACNLVAPRQSSIRRDRQNTFLTVNAFPSRLSRYNMQAKTLTIRLHPLANN